MGKIQSNLFRIDTISSESTTNSTDSELIHKICNVVYRMLTDEELRRILRSELSRERATRLEGSFGTHKQHYSLAKVRARNRKTEILWIFFGIHTSNAVLMAEKVKNRQIQAA